VKIVVGEKGEEKSGVTEEGMWCGSDDDEA